MGSRGMEWLEGDSFCDIPHQLSHTDIVAIELHQLHLPCELPT
jgi:hypothetical protein